MLGWLAGAALFLITCMVLVPAADSAAAEPGAFSFRHESGASFAGDIDGRCEGGLVFTDETPSLAFTGTRGTLRRFEVHVEELWAGPVTGSPILLDRRVESNETQIQLAPGRATIDPGPAAEVALAGGPGHVLRLVGARLQTEPALPSQPAGRWWRETEDGWVESRFTVEGWTQRVAMADGKVRHSGPLTVYVAGASVSDGHTTIGIPAYDEEKVEDYGTATRRSHVFRYAFLELPEAQMAIETATARPVCSTLSLDVVGNATFHRSTGTGPRVGAFEAKELNLEGELRVEESVDGEGTGSARTTVEGNVRAAGLDHEVMPGAPSASEFPTAVVAVAGLGLLAVIWKAGAALFTRLAPDRLMNLEARRRIQDAVAARPGTTRPELVRLSEGNLSTVRYHLRILQRHGRVRSFKLRGRWRYAPATLDVRRLATEIGVSDERTRRLLDEVGTEGTPAGRIVERLRGHWGFSRSGVWRHIRRAVSEGHLVSERRGREVILRRAA